MKNLQYLMQWKEHFPFTHDVKDQSHYQDFNFLGGMCTFLVLTSSVSAFKALYSKMFFKLSYFKICIFKIVLFLKKSNAH